MLEPDTLAKVLENAGLRAFKHSDQGQRFRETIRLRDISDVLSATPLPHDDIRTIRAGRYIECSSVDSLTHALADGATLIINNAHQRFKPIRRINAEVGKALASQAQTNLYFSQPGHGGFATHYDTHDVLVLQVSGAKSWKIYEPTTVHPLFVAKAHDRKPPLEAPYLETTLSAGDILYVPRGHWHSAFAEQQSSLHLTVGLVQPTGVDFMNWLAAELTESPKWRQSWHSAPDRHFSKLATELISRLSDRATANHYLEHFRSRILNNQAVNVPLIFPGGEHSLSEQMILAVRPAYSRIEYTDQCITVRFEGKKVFISLKAEPFLRFLEPKCSVTVRQAYEAVPTLERTTVAKLIRRLVVEGYIEVSIDEGVL